ncbi:hypothetical protein [Microcella frigidaquae]|uniref:Uncharacterized protein n=1 Tax=Microcella frigidaquae TaxID=424758 RepID=A0A840X7Q4_9MICO|nr:hypothetical protein [Microcella frigidaquae]MBB5617234.1 hypothetical protein [Microcella frigidaquae]NHN45066.1 hypothetical protein [Microcella frigidaquae]
MSGQRASVDGIEVEVTLRVNDWAALGERLAHQHSQHQADLLGAYALASGRYAMQFPLVAERLLLAEKDDPDMRATREAVQRFCRELLEHLDEGSR